MLEKIFMVYLVIGLIVAIADAWGIWSLRKAMNDRDPVADEYVEDLNERIGEEAVDIAVRKRPWWLRAAAFVTHVLIWPVSCFFTWVMFRTDKNESS